MSSFWIILFHTYVSKLKTKSFIITTLVTAIILIGLTNMTNIIDYFKKRNGTEKIAVIDETGELFPLFETKMKTINQELKLKNITNTEIEAEEQVESEEYEGLLILNYDRNQLPVAAYKSLNVADFTFPGD